MNEQIIHDELSTIREMLNKLLQQKELEENDIYESEQTNELYAALAKAQGEWIPGGKNSTNPFHKSRFANLHAVVEMTREALSRHGLAVIQQVRSVDNRSYLYTRLCHASGQFIQSKFMLNPLKAGMQEWGSVVTYARRYCLQALLGVTFSDDKEDDDGETEANNLRRVDPGATKPNMDYDRKEESAETVTKFQLNELHTELDGYPQLAKKLLETYNLDNLSQLPESLYRDVVTKIRKQKQIYAKN